MNGSVIHVFRQREAWQRISPVHRCSSLTAPCCLKCPSKPAECKFLQRLLLFQDCACAWHTREARKLSWFCIHAHVVDAKLAAQLTDLSLTLFCSGRQWQTCLQGPMLPARRPLCSALPHDSPTSAVQCS